MNILPLVLVSLLILASVSSSFFQQRKSTFWEEKFYVGHMNAERLLRNKIVSAYYKKIPTKPKPEKKTKTTGKKKEEESDYVNRREREYLTELSKLNITPLFQQKSPELYHITASLLRTLYKDAPFFQGAQIQDLEYVLLDAIISVGVANKEAVHFKDFYPEDLVLRKIFYKMAKGTQLSYPPLGDFVTLDLNKQRKPINFSSASIPLLQAAFGQEGAAKILEEERRKWEEDQEQHRLTQNNLTELLQKVKKKPFDLYKIEPLIEFSAKPSPLTNLIGKDKDTQIKVSKQVH